MLHILHGADLHLDGAFTALPARQAAQRREEQRTLPDRLAETARTRGADLVLLAGDLFDGEEVYAETTQALARALGQTGCPVLIAPGNHDPYGPRSPYALTQWPENVHIFTGPELEPVEFPERNCVVWGAAFTDTSREDSPLAGFTASADGRTHLAVLHGDMAGRGRYGPMTEEEAAASGLTYLAMGHIHRRVSLHKIGGTYWAYPGCPEGRGFDELGDKGCLWITVGDDGKVEEEFLPMAGRRYHILEVPAGEDPGGALLEALTPDKAPDICRVIFTGESGVEGLDLTALAALGEGRCYALSLRDRTTVRRDLWDRAEEDTLTGLFLRRMREKLTGAETEADRALLEQAVRFGLAALEHREEPFV